MTIFIEISAVLSRMIENSVKDNSDATRLAFLCKFFKIGFRTQHRIDLLIITGIIAMI